MGQGVVFACGHIKGNTLLETLSVCGYSSLNAWSSQMFKC